MLIEIKNLQFQAIIGIFSKEREMVQNLIIDSKIYYNPNVCETTHLESGYLDYMDVIERIKGMIINNKYGLLEVAINDILRHFLANFDAIYKMSLSITKSDIHAHCSISVTNTLHRRADSKIYRI